MEYRFFWDETRYIWMRTMMARSFFLVLWYHFVLKYSPDELRMRWCRFWQPIWLWLDYVCVRWSLLSMLSRFNHLSQFHGSFIFLQACIGILLYSLRILFLPASFLRESGETVHRLSLTETGDYWISRPAMACQDSCTHFIRSLTTNKHDKYAPRMNCKALCFH